MSKKIEGKSAPQIALNTTKPFEDNTIVTLEDYQVYELKLFGKTLVYSWRDSEEIKKIIDLCGGLKDEPAVA